MIFASQILIEKHITQTDRCNPLGCWPATRFYCTSAAQHFVFQGFNALGSGQGKDTWLSLEEVNASCCNKYARMQWWFAPADQQPLVCFRKLLASSDGPYWVLRQGLRFGSLRFDTNEANHFEATSMQHRAQFSLSCWPAATPIHFRFWNSSSTLFVLACKILPWQNLVVMKIEHLAVQWSFILSTRYCSKN